MANTYIQIYIQLIFAVKGRQNLIHNSKREDLHKYISGIIKNSNQKLLAIYANPDHIHLLVGFNSLNLKISDFVRDIKANSSRFINEQKWVNGKFNWQEGYGAFSYSKSQIDKVVSYILNQEEHHKRKSFKEEYIELLNKFEIQYEEKYMFEFDED
ncbi:IS200/IS605 family transposase [Chryseobacterium chendengshani]|uniref:IS200/IS605 family transposase n=1 Tax=unclassified Chryseobacterium TaxID=2593645 RepID=UPI001C64009F|nr:MULTISPECIES: IS200/IS605 family transposase [unclassified Chryseobacterium]MBW7676851.1 IS200/IS605 family transposase [Chryseobacterium sp. LJ756]MBW8524637.1 IS200/IS605 family transposase [Chryseobacterium sp. LJ668]QYK17360.1 IS200/IS605 family transposase [Chryseobacterium sp. LJ668]